MKKEICQYSLKEIRSLLEKHEISCVELSNYYLDRIKKYGLNDQLNCVFAINENAISEARELDQRDSEKLPLYGLTVLVKDNIDVRGMITSAGSVALKDNLAKEDAPIIQMLRKAGAIILGKTNLTEFANFLTQGLPLGYSSLGGQVLNAYDRKASPGGSSSGSAVAMSAGLCSFALGTDTSFSVVGCATNNGVVGFKPSRGSIPLDGIVPITHHFDNVSFFTRTMDDMIYIYESLFSQNVSDANLNHAFCINDWNCQNVSEKQMGYYDNVLSKLKKTTYPFTILHNLIHQN